jgi:hypothetical protein
MVSKQVSTTVVWVPWFILNLPPCKSFIFLFLFLLIQDDRSMVDDPITLWGLIEYRRDERMTDRYETSD